MSKYSVYGLISASVYLGDYEAESEEAAIEMAEADDENDFNPTLCHHCSNSLDIGDVYEVNADKIG